MLDIVISDKVVQADYDTSPLDGPSGVGLVYNSHEKLSQSCIEAANAMQIRYHVGTIASQDLFMSRDEDFEIFQTQFVQKWRQERLVLLPHSLIFHL